MQYADANGFLRVRPAAINGPVFRASETCSEWDEQFYRCYVCLFVCIAYTATIAITCQSCYWFDAAGLRLSTTTYYYY